MAISEMSDDDRAELFLVLGDVREEIRDLRAASSTLRQVVVPRDEHDVRRRYTVVLVISGIFIAMNAHDEHLEQCMNPAIEVRPGTFREFVCDATFPARPHAHVSQAQTMVGMPMPMHSGQYPTPGTVTGLALYAGLAVYLAKSMLKVWNINKRNVWR